MLLVGADIWKAYVKLTLIFIFSFLYKFFSFFLLFCCYALARMRAVRARIAVLVSQCSNVSWCTSPCLFLILSCDYSVLVANGIWLLTLAIFEKYRWFQCLIFVVQWVWECFYGHVFHLFRFLCPFSFDLWFILFFLLLRCSKWLFLMFFVKLDCGPHSFFWVVLELSSFIFCYLDLFFFNWLDWLWRPWMDSFECFNGALSCYFRLCDGIF